MDDSLQHGSMENRYAGYDCSEDFATVLVPVADAAHLFVGSGAFEHGFVGGEVDVAMGEFLGGEVLLEVAVEGVDCVGGSGLVVAGGADAVFLEVSSVAAAVLGGGAFGDGGFGGGRMLRCGTAVRQGFADGRSVMGGLERGFCDGNCFIIHSGKMYERLK